MGTDNYTRECSANEARCWQVGRIDPVGPTCGGISFPRAKVTLNLVALALKGVSYLAPGTSHDRAIGEDLPICVQQAFQICQATMRPMTS